MGYLADHKEGIHIESEQRTHKKPAALGAHTGLALLHLISINRLYILKRIFEMGQETFFS